MLSKIANLSIIGLVLLLSITVIRDRWLTPTANTIRGERDDPLVGQKINLRGVKWDSRKATVVLALSMTCGYCARSLPLYRKIADEVSHTRVGLVAVMPQAVDESRNYLVKENLRIDSVLQENLESLGVSGTPTILAVDDKGTISKAWIGFLNAQSEQTLINYIQTLKKS